MTRIKKDIPGQWATPSLREVPFWREDMMPEEYDVERAYWAIFYGLDMCKPGYLPLWKQKELGLPEYEKNYKEAYQLNQKIVSSLDTRYNFTKGVNDMSEQEIRAMAELDEAAEKAGGYVSTPFSSQTSYDYRKILAYCRENGIDVLDLTLRQLQEFIIS